MTTIVSFPVDQIVEFEAMASVDTTIGGARLCGQEGTATTTPQATDDAVAHLGADHGGVKTPHKTPAGPPVERNPLVQRSPRGVGAGQLSDCGA